MKARIKGTTEWKEYKEVFGPYNEFIGLETKGYTQTDEEWCQEHNIKYDPDSPFNEPEHYISAILPLEAFDLWEETNWQSFRNQAAKDILCSIIQSGYYGEDRIEHQSALAVKYADELIKQLKEKKEK
jgi:hypothetical protein